MIGFSRTLTSNARSVAAAVISALFLAVPGCLSVLSPERAQAAPSSVEVTPVAYYVAANRHELIRAMHRLREEDPQYDQTLRRPHPLGAPVVVNCRRTRWLGVLFHLETSESRSGRSRERRIRYTWEHSEVAVESTYYDHHHEPRYYDVRRAFAQEFVSVKKMLRVDGLLSLTASIDGETILEVSFKLEGCRDPK